MDREDSTEKNQLDVLLVQTELHVAESQAN